VTPSPSIMRTSRCWDVDSCGRRTRRRHPRTGQSHSQSPTPARARSITFSGRPKGQRSVPVSGCLSSAPSPKPTPSETLNFEICHSCLAEPQTRQFHSPRKRPDLENAFALIPGPAGSVRRSGGAIVGVPDGQTGGADPRPRGEPPPAVWVGDTGTSREDP
jgi:hypothetical protein